MNYSDTEAAQALANVIGDSRWEAVTLAYGYLALSEGASSEEAARLIYQRGPQTLKRSRELVEQSKNEGFLRLLTPRKKVGSAENPITKLFPATITEQRFSELLDKLHEQRRTVTYVDDRETGHTLTDFTLQENEDALPINIKNAGTRFERAESLVGLDPDDCVPIPAYKAHAALETVPNLLYVVSIDYELIKTLDKLLPETLEHEELIVWDLLNKHSGANLRKAEDAFIFEMVRSYWDKIKPAIAGHPYHVISARKAIRILQIYPKRTPGIGLRAWGTGASAEVNVHISIQSEMTPWDSVSERIVENGIADIIGAVNRKRVEEVYDPEI